MIIEGLPKIKCGECGRLKEQDYYTLAELNQNAPCCEECLNNKGKDGERMILITDKPDLRSKLRRESDRFNEAVKSYLTLTVLLALLVGGIIGFFVGQRGAEQKQQIVRMK